MTIFLVSRGVLAWEDSDFEPMLELGYFETEQAAVDWINSTDYLQGLYDEYVTELNVLNAERAEHHARKVEKYKLLVDKGYGDWETDPGEFYPHPTESFEDFSDDYQFKVISIARAS